MAFERKVGTGVAHALLEEGWLVSAANIRAICALHEISFKYF
jgi:hypothetical protein